MRTVKITFQVEKGREWITYGQIPDGDEISLILTADKEGSYFPSISEYRPASERIRAWWKRLRKRLFSDR